MKGHFRESTKTLKLVHHTKLHDINQLNGKGPSEAVTFEKETRLSYLLVPKGLHSIQIHNLQVRGLEI